MKPALSTDLIQVMRHATTVEPDRREVLVIRPVRFRYPLLRSGRASLALTASLLVNAALAGGVAYFAYFKPITSATNNSSPTVGTGYSAKEINALGRVQPVSGVLNIFGPPGDRITDVKVAVGTQVKAGDKLVSLAGEAERKLSADALDAQLRESEAARAAVLKSRDAKVADLTAEINQARAKLESDLAILDAKLAASTLHEGRAATELVRLEKVKSEGVPISDQELGQLKLLAAQAKAELDAIRIQKVKAADQQAAAEATAKAKRDTLSAETDRALAQIPSDSLRASREVAKQKLADAVVQAPIAGRIVKLATHPGDTITTMPLMQIADTSTMSVIAEVYETDVAQLRDWLAGGTKTVGVEIEARVLDSARPAKPLKGTVTLSQVAPMIAKNTVFALGPREDADRRVVEVEVRLDGESSKLVADFIGLQVRARFLPPK